MYGVIDGAYLCNQERTQELNERIYNRNIPSQKIQPQYDPRPVKTRRVLFPTIDCQNNSDVNIHTQKKIYNQHSHFNPGSKAPYSGYSENVDQESRLKDIFMAKQKWTGQTTFIPSSSSDLYQNTIQESPYNDKHSLLFHSNYNTKQNDNKDLDKICGYGKNLFHNHTRQQIKDFTPLK